MSNTLTPELLAQLYAQESTDPLLMLVTLSHEDFVESYYLVNNSEEIISRGQTFSPFPMMITLPGDDGETVRGVSIEFDNISLELVELIRSVTSPMSVKLEIILASMPDVVQMELDELKIQNLSYNARRISANLILDSFLNTEITSERYTPSLYPGLF